RAPRTLSRISRLRATRYDTLCRSARHGLHTPGRTSPEADSRVGTGDTSLPSLQWIGPGVGQGDSSPGVRARQCARISLGRESTERMSRAGPRLSQNLPAGPELNAHQTRNHRGRNRTSEITSFSTPGSSRDYTAANLLGAVVCILCHAVRPPPIGG